MFHDGHHKHIHSLIIYSSERLREKILTLKKNLPGTCFYDVASLLLLISVGEQTGGKTATMRAVPSLTVEAYSLSYI